MKKVNLTKRILDKIAKAINDTFTGLKRIHKENENLQLGSLVNSTYVGQIIYTA